MPCWYYDKKELRNTPSAREGLDFTTEARYRKEGARFIIDCGTKLGLRYDSCATGVVFFHRFYMFHSFKEFHRYVTAACCLFLAGKTEETPKKCKDIMKTTRTMLTDAQFSVFGEDPKEEVMTMERILLQTIKFDLMVEHPYAYLLKFAKLLKGRGSEADKAKVQKLVQMAWTFINDSLCTMLCLQWEPEVVAVSLMYLATRLNKSDVTDWLGKPAGFKGKWWEALVEDVNQELLEDVCHQVLDLYQPTPAAKSARDDTPPPPPPKPGATASTAPSTKSKRSRSPPPSESSRSRGPTPSKVPREEKRPPSPSPRSSSKDRERSSKHSSSRSSSSAPSSDKASRQSSTNTSTTTPSTVPTVTTTTATSYSQNNPFLSQNMYTSSFMSQEGSQSIQSLVGGRATYGGYTQPPPTQTATTSIAAPPPTTTTYTQPSTYPQTSYQAPGYQAPAHQQPNYQQPPPTATGYAQSSTYGQSYSYPPPQQQQQYTVSTQQYQAPQQPPLQSYGQNYTSTQTQFSTNQQYQSSYQYNHTQTYPSQPYTDTRPAQAPPPGLQPQPLMSVPRTNTTVPPVRVMGRPP